MSGTADGLFTAAFFFLFFILLRLFDNNVCNFAACRRCTQPFDFFQITSFQDPRRLSFRFPSTPQRDCILQGLQDQQCKIITRDEMLMLFCDQRDLF